MRTTFVAFLLALSLTGCQWIFQTRPTPKPGDIYALYPDAWCKKDRVLVVDVQGDFVKIRHTDGRETAERKWKFTDGRYNMIVYELDPYKCDPSKEPT